MVFDEYIRLLWDAVAIPYRFDLTTTYQEILPYARNRVAVVFCAGGSAEVTYINGTPQPPSAPTTRWGIHLYPTNQPLKLTRLEVGRYLLGPIFARVHAATDSVAVLELLASDPDNAVPPQENLTRPAGYPYDYLSPQSSREGPQAFPYGSPIPLPPERLEDLR